MNIKITGRHIELSSALRDYAEKKIKKVEKYFHQLIDTHLIMSIDRADHKAELIINGDGIQFYGIEKSGDMYSTIDLLMEKLDKQVVKYKEKHSSHKAVPVGKIISLEVENEGGTEMILDQVSNRPVNNIEAYLEMRVDNRNFILFKKGTNELKNGADFLNKDYAVIYKDTSGYKMVEIPFNMIKENNYNPDKFISYDLIISKESNLDPKIKFKKNKNSPIS